MTHCNIFFAVCRLFWRCQSPVFSRVRRKFLYSNSWLPSPYLGATGSPTVCTVGRGRPDRSPPHPEAPASGNQSGAGEPMTRSGWAAVGRHHFPRHPAHGMVVIGGVAPPPRLQGQRGKGTQCGTPSPWLAHNEHPHGWRMTSLPEPSHRLTELGGL